MTETAEELLEKFYEIAKTAMSAYGYWQYNAESEHEREGFRKSYWEAADVVHSYEQMKEQQKG